MQTYGKECTSPSYAGNFFHDHDHDVTYTTQIIVPDHQIATMRILFASKAGLIKTSLYNSIPQRFPLISVPIQWTTQKPQYRQICLPINYRYRSFTNITNSSLHYRGVRYFSSSGQREIVSIDTNEEGTPLPDLEFKLGVRTENTTERKNDEEEEPLMKSTVKKKRSYKTKKKGVSYATRKETIGNFQELGCIFISLL